MLDTLIKTSPPSLWQNTILRQTWGSIIGHRAMLLTLSAGNRRDSRGSFPVLSKMQDDDEEV